MQRVVYCWIVGVLQALTMFAPCASATAIDPPPNSYLADSPWPMAHRNPYNQHSSPLPALTAADPIQTRFVTSAPVSITLAWSGKYLDGQRVIWGNTLEEVFKIDPNGQRWSYLDTFSSSQTIENAISGAYTLVDRDGTYYVPRNNVLLAFRDGYPANIASPITLARQWKLPANLVSSPDERIVGLNITYDGFLVLVTDRGLLIILNRDFSSYQSLQLNASETISNSLAVDENGGLYVLSEKRLNKVRWQDGVLNLEWSVPYQSADEVAAGRLGKGSGTTPALMGVGEQDKFVVIADGRKLSHLLMIWRDDIPDNWVGLRGRDRRIAAEVPMRFGNPNATQSVTEQSVVVSGYDAAVVNNDYGRLFGRNRRKGRFDKLILYNSNHPRHAPHGVEKFSWNPQTRQLASAWANRHASCPNGIPTMSVASNMMFCIGADQGYWNLLGLDWQTGKVAVNYHLSKNAKFNSMYAALGIGPDGSLVSGMLRGVIKFAPAKH